jgi:hypothetical protein
LAKARFVLTTSGAEEVGEAPEATLELSLTSWTPVISEDTVLMGKKKRKTIFLQAYSLMLL